MLVSSMRRSESAITITDVSSILSVYAFGRLELMTKNVAGCPSIARLAAMACSARSAYVGLLCFATGIRCLSSNAWMIDIVVSPFFEDGAADDSVADGEHTVEQDRDKWCQDAGCQSQARCYT